MNIIDSVFVMRKRIKDKDLFKIKEVIEKEIARRTKNDEQNTIKQ